MNRPSVFVPRRLSGADSLALDLERPHVPLHLGALAFFEGRVCPERLSRRLEARLWQLGNLGRTLAPVPFALARPTFEEPLRFDPRNHVHAWALPAPGGESQLLEASARLLSGALDRGRPLFEMHVFEGLDGERGAVLLKIHCALASSCVGGLLEGLLDPSGDDAPDLAHRDTARSVRGRVARLVGAVGDDALRGLSAVTRALSLATHPRAAREAAAQLVAAGSTLFELASDAPTLLPWNAEIGWRRQLALSGLPLADASRIAVEHGCSVGEVIVSAVAGALHGYLRSAGVPLLRADARVLVTAWAVNHDSASGGATLSARVVPVPIDIADEGLRLGAVARVLRGAGACTGADSAATALLGLAGRLAPFVTRSVARGLRLDRLANVVTASIDGPREARWLCGQRLLAVHPFFPVLDGIGLSFATYAYAENLFVGINADADLVPDVDKLRLELEQSFRALALA